MAVGWRKKLVERKKRVQKKAELKELTSIASETSEQDLVKWNLTERGPLKYMEEISCVSKLTAVAGREGDGFGAPEESGEDRGQSAVKP